MNRKNNILRNKMEMKKKLSYTMQHDAIRKLNEIKFANLRKEITDLKKGIKHQIKETLRKAKQKNIKKNNKKRDVQSHHHHH